ncbi:cupin domain-containing protein [archaeon]|nr:MAG: cupin domain-containing protein [archaeon]
MKAVEDNRDVLKTSFPSAGSPLSKEEVIKKFNMQQHPEGGYYVETFRSNITVQTPIGERCASTAILFLLGQGDCSNLHRIRGEEAWHYYAGGPIAIVEQVEGSKTFNTTILGPNIEIGHKLQHVVPANVWFGAYVDHPHAEYSLVGCTVAPGFDFQVKFISFLVFLRFKLVR